MVVVTLILAGVIVGLITALSLIGSPTVRIDVPHDDEARQPSGCATIVWLVVIAIVLLVALAGGAHAQSPLVP